MCFCFLSPVLCEMVLISSDQTGRDWQRQVQWAGFYMKLVERVRRTIRMHNCRIYHELLNSWLYSTGNITEHHYWNDPHLKTCPVLVKEVMSQALWRRLMTSISANTAVSELSLKCAMKCHHSSEQRAYHRAVPSGTFQIYKNNTS